MLKNLLSNLSLSGASECFPSTFDLSAINGKNGFRIPGITDSYGLSLSTEGDINGDGIHDIVIGARTTTLGGKSYSGESYVIFGSKVSVS